VHFDDGCPPHDHMDPNRVCVCVRCMWVCGCGCGCGWVVTCSNGVLLVLDSTKEDASAKTLAASSAPANVSDSSTHQGTPAPPRAHTHTRTHTQIRTHTSHTHTHKLVPALPPLSSGTHEGNPLTLRYIHRYIHSFVCI
jgi:hypothetical protein